MGVYSIPCECGQVYIGQKRRSIDTRLKALYQHIPLEYPDKSAMAEHSINLGHCIQLHNTTILSTKPIYRDRNIREATKIALHPNNMNREHGFCLSKSWKPFISSLKDCMKSPSQGSTDGFSAGPHRLYTLPYQGTNSILLSQLATCVHTGFLLGLFFDPEDGSDMFLRKDG
jgi:hypothetical protein